MNHTWKGGCERFIQHSEVLLENILWENVENKIVGFFLGYPLTAWDLNLILTLNVILWSSYFFFPEESYIFDLKNEKDRKIYIHIWSSQVNRRLSQDFWLWPNLPLIGILEILNGGLDSKFKILMKLLQDWP